MHGFAGLSVFQILSIRDGPPVATVSKPGRMSAASTLSNSRPALSRRLPVVTSKVTVSPDFPATPPPTIR
jgi:hypothetical protein